MAFSGENFWRPQFAIWRLNIFIQSPVVAHIKELISDPAAIHLKRGKLSTGNNSIALPVSNNCTIPVLSSDDHYKFLGKYQNSQHLEDKVIEEAAKEYENRLWAVWTSLLSVPRKVRATNIYALHAYLTILHVVNRLVY